MNSRIKLAWKAERHHTKGRHDTQLLTSCVALDKSLCLSARSWLTQVTTGLTHLDLPCLPGRPRKPCFLENPEFPAGKPRVPGGKTPLLGAGPFRPSSSRKCNAFLRCCQPALTSRL